jgi:hypothetical protein
MSELKTYSATRYLQPLREGGSLPAVVDTDGGLFVVKFRGAGQGRKALLAELIVGLIAQELGLPVPEIALVEIAEEFGRSEPDPEIQDLLRLSRGLNVGMRYLDGAFNFDASAAGELISPELAADIVWLDALLTNPDRTHRNPNLMIHGRAPWLIDHGAALYAHHNWGSVNEARIRAPFPLIDKHVLLRQSADLVEVDRRLAERLTPAVIEHVLALLPDALLLDETSGDATEPGAAQQERERYREYLALRLQPPRAFVAAAVEAQERVRREPPPVLRARR